MSKFLKILNYVAFQICWLALLIYGNIAISLVILYLIIHFLLIYYIDNFNFIKLELVTILSVCIIGILFDSVMFFGNVYLFNTKVYIPLWYLFLWPLYASTLNHSFYLFLNLPILVLAAFAVVCMPIIYLGATQLTSNFTIGEPVYTSLILIAVEWSILFPLTMKLAVFLKEHILIKKKKFLY